eukprot:767714-Hanusia_phi.AAC.2
METLGTLRGYENFSFTFPSPPCSSSLAFRTFVQRRKTEAASRKRKARASWSSFRSSMARQAMAEALKSVHHARPAPWPFTGPQLYMAALQDTVVTVE